MELLDDILTCLDQTEIAELRIVLRRTTRTEAELRLLNVMLRHPAGRPREIAGKLYSPVNMNAYHSLRKRLLSRITKYVVEQRVSAESNAPESPLALMTMARFLLERHQSQAALHYLRKAEGEAALARRYDLLERMYQLMVDHAGELGISAVEVSQKWEVNAERYATFRRLKMAQAIIHDRFEEVRERGFPPDPDSIIDPVLKSISITAEEANNPAFQLTLAAIIRRVYASVKEYDRIERFVCRVYRRLDQTGAFSTGDTAIRAKFLYMGAHALYRTRSFAACLELLNELQEVLQQSDGAPHRLRAKALSLEAAVYTYTGDNGRSIALLERALNDNLCKSDLRELLNMRLNLAVYYFNAQAYRQANRMLSQIALSDRKIDEVMGVEWRFKRGMIALIVQYELGNTELALTMIRRLQNEFRSQLSHRMYDRAAAFLQYIMRLINHPEEVHTAGFRDEIKTTSMMLTGGSDDIQGIAFFCWIRSKMFKRLYYDELVERLNEASAVESKG